MFDDLKKTIRFTRWAIGECAKGHRLRSRTLGASGPISAARAVELAGPIAMNDHKPPLPMPFRDSSEAVATLSGEVDFVSGSTDISLSTHRAEDGQVMWEAQAGGTIARTPFAADRVPSGS